MNIAILISGLPRRQLQNLWYFRRFIRSQNDIFIFSHYWHDKQDRNLNSPNSKRFHEKAPQFIDQVVKFGFKSIIQKSEIPESWDLGPNSSISDASVEAFYPWGEGYLGGIENFKCHLLSNNISMWNSIKKSFDILDRYAADKKINFDYVVRMRYDVIPSISIDDILMQISDESILVPDTQHPENMTNDWFAIGNVKAMSVYMNFFDNFPEIFLETQIEFGVWCNELGLSKYLRKNRIDVKTADLKMLFH